MGTSGDLAGRAANLAVAVTAVGWLVGHAVLEMTTSVPRALAHSWILSAYDGLTFLGCALVLPFPRLAGVGLLALAAATIGTVRDLATTD